MDRLDPQLGAALRSFSAALFGHWCAELGLQDNVVCAPVSVFWLLASLAAAAEPGSATQRELLGALDLHGLADGRLGEMLAQLKMLLVDTGHADEATSLRLSASAIFARDARPECQAALRASGACELHAMSGAADELNYWAHAHTFGVAPRLLDPSPASGLPAPGERVPLGLAETTALAAFSVCYESCGLGAGFEADCMAFSRATDAADSSLCLASMRRTFAPDEGLRCGVLDGDVATLVEIPHASARFRTVIVVPAAAGAAGAALAWAALAPALSVDVLDALLQPAPRATAVHVPLVVASCEMPLYSFLAARGVRAAFAAASGGFAPLSAASPSLHIAVHRAHLRLSRVAVRRPDVVPAFGAAPADERGCADWPRLVASGAGAPGAGAGGDKRPAPLMRQTSRMFANLLGKVSKMIRTDARGDEPAAAAGPPDAAQADDVWPFQADRTFFCLTLDMACRLVLCAARIDGTEL